MAMEILNKDSPSCTWYKKWVVAKGSSLSHLHTHYPTKLSEVETRESLFESSRDYLKYSSFTAISCWCHKAVWSQREYIYIYILYRNTVHVLNIIVYSTSYCWYSPALLNNWKHIHAVGITINIYILQSWSNSLLFNLESDTLTFIKGFSEIKHFANAITSGKTWPIISYLLNGSVVL